MLNNSFNYGFNFVIYLMPEMKISPLISFCNKLSSQQGDETHVTVLLWQWVPSSSCNIISHCGSCITVINSEWSCFIVSGAAGGLPCAVSQRVKNGILCRCLCAWGSWGAAVGWGSLSVGSFWRWVPWQPWLFLCCKKPWKGRTVMAWEQDRERIGKRLWVVTWYLWLPVVHDKSSA